MSRRTDGRPRSDSGPTASPQLVGTAGSDFDERTADEQTGEEQTIDAATAALLRVRAAAEARGERRVRSAAALRRTAARDAVARTGAPRRNGRDPLNLGSVVTRMVQDRGWSTPVSVGSVIGRWPQIVGPEIAAHCTPDAFRETTLHVVCDSTAWATQVRLLVPSLLARFDAEIGPGILTAIKVSGPTAPSWRKGPRHVRGRGPRDTYG